MYEATYEVTSWNNHGPVWSVGFHSYDSAIIFARNEANDNRNTFRSIVMTEGFTTLMSWHRQDGKVVERLHA